MYVLFYICGAAAAACQLLNKRICKQQRAQSQSTNAGSNTTYTSDTIDQQHKAQTKQLKASNAKNGSHEFPEFLLEKFRNFGTWGKTEFPEIRKSEFPELQSLVASYKLIYRPMYVFSGRPVHTGYRSSSHMKVIESRSRSRSQKEKCGKSLFRSVKLRAATPCSSVTLPPEPQSLCVAYGVLAMADRTV